MITATQEIGHTLSSLQKGMLFDTLIDRNQGVYSCQMTFNFDCGLDISLFKKSFQILFERYDILRTCLSSDMQSLFINNDKITLPFTYIDLSQLPDNEKQQKLNNILLHDRQEGFYQLPSLMMKVCVLRISKTAYKAIWTRHHLLLDGISAHYLVNELFSNYDKLTQQETIPHQEKVPYETIPENTIKSSDSKTAHYWQQHLKNYSLSKTTPVEATLTTNSNTKQLAIENILIKINKTTTDKIIDFCKQASTTATMGVVLQAAWAKTLSVYSQSPVVNFGFVRSYPQAVRKNKLGLYINTLPVAVDFNSLKKISNLLNTLAKHSQQIKKDVDIPLNTLREISKVPIEFPLFDTIVDFKKYSINDALNENHPDIKVTCNFDLATNYIIVVEATQRKEGLDINFRYHDKKYTRNYMQRVAAYFELVLKEIINQTDQPIEKLTEIHPDELKKIDSFNRHIIRHYDLNQSIHGLFEKQVTKTPDAIAISYRGHSLSYREVNEKANVLAHYLMHIGMQKSQRIVLHLKEGIDTIISILAALKAGCIYTYINPSYPTHYIPKIINQLKPQAIILDCPLIKDLQIIQHGLKIVNVTLLDLTPSRSVYSSNNPNVNVTGDDSAYIIYTSGTTGVPHGVEVKHSSVINTISYTAEALKVDEKSKLLQIASLSFDVAVAEWATGLLFGAQLFLMRKTFFNPEEIFREIENNKITTIIVASSILSALPKKNLPSLQTIAIGGESPSLDCVNYWSESHELIQIYGITEASICSTIKSPLDKKSLNCVGKPYPNTKIYILDEKLCHTPIGVPGEIYISGAGLAKGYWNNNTLNDSKFLNNLPVKLSGNNEIFYRTHDKGAWLENGELEFLGRQDDIIKFRGHSVSLKDIESVIQTYPGINRVAVLLQKISNADEIIAYLSVDDIETFSQSELKKHIANCLPFYVNSTHIFILDEMPLTQHGKINKSLLKPPTPDVNKPLFSHKNKYVKLIVDTISAILPFNKIDKDLTFMALGLNSLLMLELANKLSKELGEKIPVTLLFTYFTPKSLGDHLKNKAESEKNMALQINNSINRKHHAFRAFAKDLNHE